MSRSGLAPGARCQLGTLARSPLTLEKNGRRRGEGRKEGRASGIEMAEFAFPPPFGALFHGNSEREREADLNQWQIVGWSVDTL